MLRNGLAVIAGIVVGAVLNGALVGIGPSIIAPPEGIDVSSPARLRASIHLFEPRHFVMPFLAHALGTFTGALVAFLIAASSRARMAYVVGAVFLTGGIIASRMIPAPAWFIALDLIGAYLPMAWLAAHVGRRIKPASR